MKKLTLPAPAKINRFLHITGQRPDGYHELQTLLQLIDYHDEISFQRRRDKKIHLYTETEALVNENNLITRAAQLLQYTNALTFGADIHLHKRIPMGAGLGGGSSDAATTLLGLNALWELNLPLQRLAQLGLQLGADIPFFIGGETAFAQGVGERLHSVELPDVWIAVFIPPIHISTVDVFAAHHLSRNTPRQAPSLELIDKGHNDCEPIVRGRYPEVNAIFDWLNDKARAQLTGTGACVFVICEDAIQARELAMDGEKALNIRTFVAKSLQKSPVHSILHNYAELAKKIA